MTKMLATLGVLGTLIIAGAHPGPGRAAPAANCGGTCDGGGYGDLPRCGPARYGQVLWSHGYMWLCIYGTPWPQGPGDHWIRVAP